MMIGEVLAKNKYICLLTSPLCHALQHKIINMIKIKYIGGDICLPLRENKKYGIGVNTLILKSGCL